MRHQFPVAVGKRSSAVLRDVFTSGSALPILGPKAKSVIVTATRFKGGLKLEKRGKARVVTGQNIRE